MSHAFGLCGLIPGPPFPPPPILQTPNIHTIHTYRHTTNSKSGQPFEYVRSLYVAALSDHQPLGKEAIWAVYQELRRLGPQLAAEAGTALYLPMLGCNDRVEGFGSGRAQRHVRACVRAWWFGPHGIYDRR